MDARTEAIRAIETLVLEGPVYRGRRLIKIVEIPLGRDNAAVIVDEVIAALGRSECARPLPEPATAEARARDCHEARGVLSRLLARWTSR